MELDKMDRELLNIIQTGLPICREPYCELAEKLGTTAEDVMARLQRLIKGKVIRRLGAIFDSRKIGYTGTLCAMKVPVDRIDEVAGVINSYPGVTHNYLRDSEYNMWFTLIAPGEGEINRITDQIKAGTGIDKLINLPAVRLFKIKVNFNLAE